MSAMLGPDAHLPRTLVKTDDDTYTASDALLDALEQTGVTHIYANFGSDHPEIIEALAKRQSSGRSGLRVIVCPHESVALAAAHGHAMASGQAQAVFVHVDVGTQTMGGAVHNAFRARAPVFIFAGETPYTIEGELFGSRNRPAQVLQDVPDQHGVMRAYVKWSMSVRTGRNIQQLVYRAMQIAQSEPRGLVYLTGAREVMSERVAERIEDRSAQWPVQAAGALPDAVVQEMALALAGASRPVVVTSYAGRRAEAVHQLTQLAERIGAMVVEESPVHLNFPRDHDLHGGYLAQDVVADADVILLLDCDVPWMNATVSLRSDVRIYHVDVDPLKTTIPLWHVPVRVACAADTALALEQINASLPVARIDAEAVQRRKAQAHEKARARALARRAATANDSALAVEQVCSALRALIDDETIIIDETVTNSLAVLEGIPRRLPGTYLSSGGSSLGFGGGGSIGVRLAQPKRTVICITGDGSYLFGVPSAVHMISATHAAPFLTVILNNGGWNATKQNVLRLHPQGVATRTDHFWVNLGQDADLAGVAAAAGGSLARTVNTTEGLSAALQDGLRAVHQGRSAVIDVKLPPISRQVI